MSEESPREAAVIGLDLEDGVVAPRRDWAQMVDGASCLATAFCCSDILGLD